MTSTVLCPHCGVAHDTTCPDIKAIEYYPDGTLKRVEFLLPTDYPPVSTIVLMDEDLKSRPH